MLEFPFLEAPYAHINASKEFIEKTTQNNLSNILSINKNNFFDHFPHPNNPNDDYPVFNRPYSSIENILMKDSYDENKENPYSVVLNNSQFMRKLTGLKQYGIHTQTIGENLIYIHDHNRLVHSFDTAFNMEMVMRNNDYVEETIRKGIIAGFLHDIATPVFGDLTMKTFPDLSEEKNFIKFLEGHPEAVKEIEETFDVKLEQLNKRVQNDEEIGKLLDICDRISYTMRDVKHLVSRTDFVEGEHEYIRAIKKELQEDELLFDVILDIKIIDGKIVFQDADKLRRIMTIRACMHNLIYLNPYLWSREEYMGLVIKFLVEKGIYTKNNLTNCFDNDNFTITENSMAKFYNQGLIPHNPTDVYDYFSPHIYDNKEEALAKYKTIKAEGGDVPVTIIKTPPFKSGGKYFTQKDGEIVTLTETLSEEEDNQLEGLAKNTHKYVVLCPQEQYWNADSHKEFNEFLSREDEEVLRKMGG